MRGSTAQQDLARLNDALDAAKDDPGNIFTGYSMDDDPVTDYEVSTPQGKYRFEISEYLEALHMDHPAMQRIYRITRSGPGFAEGYRKLSPEEQRRNILAFNGHSKEEIGTLMGSSMPQDPEAPADIAEALEMFLRPHRMSTCWDKIDWKLVGDQTAQVEFVRGDWTVDAKLSLAEIRQQIEDPRARHRLTQGLKDAWDAAALAGTVKRRFGW